MILILILVEHGPRDSVRLADLSPIFASIHLSEEIFERPADVVWTCGSITFWLHVVAGAAVLFSALTLATFNRCLGRTSDLSPGGSDWPI